MAHLRIVTRRGALPPFPLSGTVVRAGRAHSNQLRIDDPAASREHFEIRVEGGEYLIRDLGSRNGTLVNGTPISGSVRLSPGDEIAVGSTRLVLGRDEAAEPAKGEELDPGTVMFEAAELSREFLSSVEAGSDVAAVRNVALVNEVARQFMGVADEAALLELLVQRMLTVFQCDRCAVVYRGDDPGAGIDVRAVARATDALSREVQISSTAARHVIDDAKALLITDVLADERFKAQESILQGNISSILCAPLWHGGTVFGLLYLDTTGRLGIFGKEQLALLSAFANLAAIKIDNLRLVDASIAKARMERELALAAEIQQKMLPREPFSFPGFRSIGFNSPCYEVGGDYFDFRSLHEGVFTVTVADVSGKGASGALLMASVKSMLTAFIDTGVPILERVDRLNRYVIDNSTSNKFVTFFHAEVDGAAGVLRYCNAGHNPPVLVAPDGSTTLLEATGPVLGLLELPYEVQEAELVPGALVVAYSDGVTEALDPADEEFGEDRLISLVSAHPVADPAELRDLILAEVQRFTAGAPQNDDVTLVILLRDATPTGALGRAVEAPH